MSSQQDAGCPAGTGAIPQCDNPFAVSRVGLGGVAYLEPRPGFLADVAHRLERGGWQGQITGPHGSGKSTLTIALAKRLSERFARFSWLVAQPPGWFGGRPRARTQLAARSIRSSGPTGLELVAFQLEEPGPRLVPRLEGLVGDELCFLDGLELLSPWRQRQVLQAATGRAVVWTVHRPLAGTVPMIAQLRPDSETFQRLVAELLAPASVTLPAEVIARAFQQSEGDFRRGLSQLYDAWEHFRRDREVVETGLVNPPRPSHRDR